MNSENLFLSSLLWLIDVTLFYVYPTLVLARYPAGVKEFLTLTMDLYHLCTLKNN